MSKPRSNQGAPDEPESTVERKPPENPPQKLAVPEEPLAAANTARDPTIINRIS